MPEQQVVTVDVSSMPTEPNIGRFSAAEAPHLIRTYVQDGTAVAAVETLSRPDGQFYDALQLRAGPYSSFVIGSYAMAKSLIPPLEVQTDLDLGASREYRAVSSSIALTDGARHEAAPGIASIPANEVWAAHRRFWRESIQPVDAERVRERFSKLHAEYTATDGTVDLKRLAYATGIDEFMHNTLDVTLSPDQLAVLADTGAEQERDTTEGFTTFFLVQPKFTKHALQYEILKRQSSAILDEALFDGTNPKGVELLELSHGSRSAAKTQAMHMILGARGLANSIYWGVHDLYRSPHMIDYMRENNPQIDYDDLATEAISQFPGAWINTRSQEKPLHIDLVRDDEAIGELEVGSMGRAVISAYLWGQNPQLTPSLRRQAAFGVGRRRCPGEKIALGVAPQLIETLVTEYDVTFPDVEMAGHGFSLSPRPNANAKVIPRAVTTHASSGS